MSVVLVVWLSASGQSVYIPVRGKWVECLKVRNDVFDLWKMEAVPHSNPPTLTVSKQSRKAVKKNKLITV